MPEIDYALAYELINTDEPDVRYRLRFRPDTDYRVFKLARSNPTGQLVAVVLGPRRRGNGRTVAISRSHVHFNDVEIAVDRDNLPFLAPFQVDLNEIRRRIQAAGLA